jgi:rRNA processing protein Krr1/Pno1
MYWVVRGTGTPKHRDDVVYYEKIKRELNKKVICECRCDERLKTISERSTRLTYTVAWGTEANSLVENVPKQVFSVLSRNFSV